MSNRYTEYTVPADSEEQAEIMIAELADFGFESFSDYLPQEGQVKAYIPSDIEKDVKTDIDSYLQDAGKHYERTEIEQQNWNATWEAGFEPIDIQREGVWCYIRAPFHPAREVDHQIVIMPKMSFGTGHHATTALMVEAMLGLDFAGTTVLDMGSGTGILAILAAQRGAVVVDAVDVDDWAYENCLENVQANGVQSAVCPILGDASSIGDKIYDIILANINRNILLRDMEQYVRYLRSGGLLLVSGILEMDVETIDRKGRELGMSQTGVHTKEGWAQITFQKS